MKQKIFIICFLMAAYYLAKSQTVPTRQKIVKPKTFLIKLNDGKLWNYGYLSSINDSSVQLSSKRVNFSYPSIENQSYKSYNYKYDDIEKRISIRKYGRVGRGIGYGVLIGAGTGAIFGLATYKKPDPNEPFSSLFDIGPGGSSVIGAFMGLLPGVIIGAIIGSKKKKFYIKRNKEKFEEMKSTILEMALSKRVHMTDDSTNVKYIRPSFN